MSFNLNKNDIAKCGRDIGITIRWNAEWSEFQVYPKGTGVDHPSAYFTGDGEDVVGLRIFGGGACHHVAPHARAAVRLDFLHGVELGRVETVLI
jgi:hypothetical protein